ncbi:MAG: DUF1987 domain-containing protein [Flavobacteriales bacterium]|nr:DUF1987 domain-containing protein [Flavobacteriales bacterium]
MESLFIAPTETTPKIDFNYANGVFSIEGKAINSEPEEFFRPVLEWLDEYSAEPNASTQVTVKLDYFNISSSKRILFIFYKLNELIDAGHDVSVKWFYHEDEDDMYEVGQDFAFMVKVPFEFCEYSLFEKVLA